MPPGPWKTAEYQFKGDPVINSIRYVKCDNCGNDDFNIVFPSTLDHSAPEVGEFVSTSTGYARYHDVVRCRHCGLMYMNPRDGNVENLYRDVVDHKYIESWPERTRTFGELIKIVSPYKSGGRLLDLGTYGGIFCQVALEKGYDVVAVEPSTWGSTYARERTGATVIQGTAEKVDLGERMFDLITLWDVVEHLEEPLKCFTRLREHLEDDGILAITTHDIDSLFARLMGAKYPWLMRFHLYHFSPKTLSRLLAKAGYECVKTQYFTKHFSIAYLLGRFGITVRGGFFSDFTIPVMLGDMFIGIYRKGRLPQRETP